MPDSEAKANLTHGRHCRCSACARQDWSDPRLAPCGMHGPACPPVYAPIDAPLGTRVGVGQRDGLVTMNERTRAKALDALEGMRQIVRREMLVRGKYVEDQVSNPRLAGAICGGRKHCAMGSLWAGAGVTLVRDEYNDLDLPGISEPERENFTRHRPWLRLALTSLNDAAQQFADKRGLLIPLTWQDSIEGLFETQWERALTKRDLLAVIAAAKRKVKAMSQRPLPPLNDS